MKIIKDKIKINNKKDKIEINKSKLIRNKGHKTKYVLNVQK